MTKLQQNLFVLRVVRCNPGMTTGRVQTEVALTLKTTQRRLKELDRSGLIQFIPRPGIRPVLSKILPGEHGWWPVEEAEE